MNMKALPVFTIMTALITGIASAETANFDDLKTGAPPPGWTATKTGSGEAKWAVVADDSAPSKPNVLKQSGEATYPVCIKDDTSLKDGYVEGRKNLKFYGSILTSQTRRLIDLVDGGDVGV